MSARYEEVDKQHNDYYHNNDANNECPSQNRCMGAWRNHVVVDAVAI